MSSFINKLCKLPSYLKIKCKEKKYKKRLNYLFYNNDADSLYIIFSAFGSSNIRKYNYLKSLSTIRGDRLYILDPFGYKGSYNLYENGDNYPETLTTELINSIISKKKYKRIYTIGTSKGGTCAIYWGLKINATEIFSGACQYNLGDYLANDNHWPIFKSMMGASAGMKERDVLNNILPLCIETHKKSTSIIHILYSPNDPTYKHELLDLMSKLESCEITYKEIIVKYENHSDVGFSFIEYLKDYFILS